MAFLSIEVRKKYMRDYYKKRREYAIKKLGGECNKCGNKDKLEFDHVDKNIKNFSIGKLMCFSKNKLEEELKNVNYFALNVMILNLQKRVA